MKKKTALQTPTEPGVQAAVKGAAGAQRRGGQSSFRAFAHLAGFPAFPDLPQESSCVSQCEAHAAGADREGTMSCPGTSRTGLHRSCDDIN
jgi:hypothetical protein